MASCRLSASCWRSACRCPDPIKIGILIMGCMPGGTTSNIFTYFSKGNLALSVLMTVNSTVFGVLLIPLVLVIYAGALDLQIPRENIIATLVLLLVPVAIGMGLRKLNANAGAVTEFHRARCWPDLHPVPDRVLDSEELGLSDDDVLGHLFRRDCMLGVFGFAIGYGFATLLGCIRAMPAPSRWKPAFRTGRWRLPSSPSPSPRPRPRRYHGGTGALFAVHRDYLDDADPLVPPRSTAPESRNCPTACCSIPATHRRRCAAGVADPSET
jgi:hypothetical protein